MIVLQDMLIGVAVGVLAVIAFIAFTDMVRKSGISNYNALLRPVRMIDFYLRNWVTSLVADFPKKGRYIAAFRNNYTRRIYVAYSVSDYKMCNKIPDMERLTPEPVTVTQVNAGNMGIYFVETLEGACVAKFSFNLYDSSDIQQGKEDLHDFLYHEPYVEIEVKDGKRV